MKDRLSSLGWFLIASGFAAIGGGWAGVQSTPVVAVQLSYLVSGGLVGVALVMVGVGLLRQDDLRVIRAAVEELRDRLDDLPEDLAHELRLTEAGGPQAASPVSRAARNAS
jgi:hypothetical protein